MSSMATPEWRRWERMYLAHARTGRHRRAVAKARAHVLTFLAEQPVSPYVAWSAGKDSTALTHLVCVEMGEPMSVMSVKDDCDFPGEEAYLLRLAGQWNLDLEIVRPEQSLWDWLVTHRPDLSEDIHSRQATLSAQLFYRLIDDYVRRHDHDACLLGLRTAESHHRAMNRALRGAVYRRQDGLLVGQPLCDWRAEDVYGYLLVRGIEPLHVYRQVLPGQDPGRIRKSWWVPGAQTRHGYVVWLRRYYPDLYRRLVEVFPEMRQWS